MCLADVLDRRGRFSRSGRALIPFFCRCVFFLLFLSRVDGTRYRSPWKCAARAQGGVTDAEAKLAAVQQARQDQGANAGGWNLSNNVTKELLYDVVGFVGFMGV